MSNVNWKPFVFGGLASVTAECGEWWDVRQGGQAAWITVIYLNLCAELLSSKCSTSSCCVPGTFPIDLAKTRLQVQGQVGDSKYREIRYRGMLHAIVRIGREEGLRALYSGSVCCIYEHVCGCCYFCLPQKQHDYLNRYPHPAYNLHHTVHVSCICYLFLGYFLFWSGHCSVYPHLGPVATHQYKGVGGVCVRLACPSVYPPVFILC